ncbi:MAG: type I 3-dehydroquinate dehydratase [Thermoplasmata archaeon]|nr:type I 3-dehydroquinate dehydratase [Thermoplasmata archaeon]
MTGLPRLIVTLPARSLAEAHRQRAAAHAAGADLAEVRFDRWPESERSKAAGLFPTPLPLVATLRSSAEGGEGPVDRAQRRGWIDQMRALPFAMIDLELERDSVEGWPPGGPGVLGSRHFSERSSVDAIETFLGHAPAGCALVKAVVPSTVGRFVRDLLPRYPSWVGVRSIVLTTGPSGPLARLWAPELGQPVVFAALPDGASTPPVDPAQIPADQLRRLWAGARPRCLAVVGSPVAHSLSPAIHGVWLADEGRAGAFVAIDVTTRTEFEQMLDLGRAGKWWGWSVTHPWKGLAAAVADEKTDAVLRTRVANTLTFRRGQIFADLTDASALARRTTELSSEGRWDRREALVVGTGGAARAAVLALATGGSEVRILGRDGDAVDRVASEVGGVAADERDRHAVGLVVHGTTVGRGDSGPLEPGLDGWIGPGSTVLDFVYAARDPQIPSACDRAGARYEDGRRLLVYQAADAHRIWWGSPPRAAAIRDALGRVGCTA